MQSVRVREFGGPERLLVEQVDEPRPGPGEIVVAMHAVGVNPVDTYIRSGTHTVKPALPYTPGIDGAGVVVEVGADVSRRAIGDRVYLAGSVSGTYAERALCRESQTHRLPSRASFAEGAALGIPYATAYRALFQAARAVPGEHVLIHGASGGVGIAAVQLARAAGLVVLGTAGTERGRLLVSQQGAHHVLNHNDRDLAGTVLGLTGGRGVDVVVEMVANLNLSSDLALLAPRGRVAVVGSRGMAQINPRDAMTREAAIVGVFILNAAGSELAAIHAALYAALESGAVAPFIGRQLPLAEARQAHATVMKPGAYGKLILVPETAEPPLS